MNLIRSLRALALAALGCGFAATAVADMFQPSHGCVAPVRPHEFNSQWEIDSFRNQVEMYRQCIEDFVDEQHGAINAHSRAADDAIDDWNLFANTVLNRR